VIHSGSRPNNRSWARPSHSDLPVRRTSSMMRDQARRLMGSESWGLLGKTPLPCRCCFTSATVGTTLSSLKSRVAEATAATDPAPCAEEPKVDGGGV
jgi:hypothetical protein